MTISTIGGSIMFIIGVALLLLEVVAQAKEVFGLGAGEEGGQESMVSDAKDVIEAVAKLLEAFGKFSERVQRLLLGTALMLGGLYLISSQPF